MKLKITEPGWAGFNGHLGMTEFKDGVTVNEITDREANLIGAVIRVVEVNGNGDELGQVSASAELVRITKVPIPVATPMKSGEGDESPDIEAQNATKSVQVEAPAPMPLPSNEAPQKVYTLAELEAVADADGIKGLREIATPLGVKGTSIPKMIDDIVAAQKNIKE